MNNKEKKSFDSEKSKEITVPTQVMLQRTKRHMMPHEWLKLLGIMNEIQRAKLKKKNTTRAASLSKPLINRLIRWGYTLYALPKTANSKVRWFEIKW